MLAFRLSLRAAFCSAVSGVGGCFLRFMYNIYCVCCCIVNGVGEGFVEEGLGVGWGEEEG